MRTVEQQFLANSYLCITLKSIFRIMHGISIGLYGMYGNVAARRVLGGSLSHNCESLSTTRPDAGTIAISSYILVAAKHTDLNIQCRNDLDRAPSGLLTLDTICLQKCMMVSQLQHLPHKWMKEMVVTAVGAR